MVSSGEEFPSGNRNHSSRGGAPSAIQLIQKMEPSGYLTLASNTTITTTVYLIIQLHVLIYIDYIHLLITA